MLFMDHCLRNLLIAFAAALAICSGATAYGATLVDCQLVLDGSSDPPGDRIDCAAYLAEGESRAEFVIHAFVVSAASGEAPLPVKSSDPKLRDADGSLVVRATAEPASGEHAVKLSIVLPYAAIDLPRGEHRLGYEVELRVDGVASATQPLALTIVRIGEQERHELKPRSLEKRTAEVDAVVPATIASGAKNGALRRTDVRLRAEHGERLPERQSAVVPRGFERGRAEGKAIDDRRLAELSGQPWRRADSVLTREQRIVSFATNRALLKSDAAVQAFDARLGDLAYGQCVVNFPIRAHRRGRLERPNWWSSLNPEKHFLVESLNFMDRDQLMKILGPDDVLLFVHGFANGFEDAVMCAAQLAHDVDFRGKPMTFCWPSAATVSTTAYAADEKNALASVDALAEVLSQLTARSGAGDSAPAGKVHVIAHSMGNKLLLQTIYRLIARGDWPPDEKRLGQVILAAPDVGAANFNNLIDYVIGLSDRVTYYYSRDDRALTVSQQANKYEPVGMYPYFQRGLDTINVEGAGIDFLGHSYYSSSVKILADFELLLKYGLEPGKRMPPLGALTKVFGHEHWSFLPIVATAATGEGN